MQNFSKDMLMQMPENTEMNCSSNIAHIAMVENIGMPRRFLLISPQDSLNANDPAVERMEI